VAPQLRSKTFATSRSSGEATLDLIVSLQGLQETSQPRQQITIRITLFLLVAALLIIFISCFDFGLVVWIIAVGRAIIPVTPIRYGRTSLAGHGVSAIPTDVKMGVTLHQCKIVNFGGDVSMIAKVRVLDKYYALPTGEQVHASCTNGQETVDLGAATLTLCKGRGCASGPYDQAFFGIRPDQTGNWSCRVTYDGNGVLAGGVDAVDFQIVDGGGHCH
jgi:hypothetical protein